MAPISVPKTLDSFTELWAPRLIASVNDQHVKIAKADGAFIFHSHPDSDEMFYLISGKLTMEIEDKPEETVVMAPGDVYVVPRGVRHKPICEGAHFIMIEQAGTVNTGDEAKSSDRTVVPVDISGTS